MDSGKHIWTFKIDRFDVVDAGYHACRFTFGIWNAKSKKDPPLEGHFSDWFDGVNGGYSQVLNDWTETVNKPKLKTNDIVEMILNFENLELSFNINDKQVNNTKIEKNEYRAAVNLYIEGDSVSLLSYKCSTIQT